MTDLADLKRKAPVERRHREMAIVCLWGAQPTTWETQWIETGKMIGSRSDLLQAERISQALADIEAAAKPKWISCSERMPLTGLTVIVDGGCAFFDGIDWRTMTGTGSGEKITWKVTHWQPLPELPALPPPPEST